MAAALPWLITASADVEPGYTETVCVECANIEATPLTVDGVVIT